MAQQSRETYEESERAWLESEFPRGPGDGDWYGYPGEELSAAATDDCDKDIPF